ncbi:MAG: hypothetical protein ACTSWL_09175 [Promethearchaeota archaeon]
MSEIYCFYHPDRKAVDRCENCGKMLCLECKRMDHQVKGVSFDERYESTRVLCPECYNITIENRNLNNKNGLKIFGFVALGMCALLGLGVLAMVLFGWSMFNNF